MIGFGGVGDLNLIKACDDRMELADGCKQTRITITKS